MNSMKKIEEAVRITLDPIRRGEQIGRLEKRLQFSRAVLLIFAVAIILSVIASVLCERTSTSLASLGISLAVTALLSTGHMAAKLRLVQLKVEEERYKKEQNECVQGAEGDAVDRAP
jgi:uncharacterized membrane-anchored protein YitT (DUF2179 family)